MPIGKNGGVNMPWFVKWRTANGIVPSIQCGDPEKVREIFDQMDSGERNPRIEDDDGKKVARETF
jgi:hypothetical protein